MKIASDQVGRILATELRAKEAAKATHTSGVRADKVSLSARAADLQAAQRALASAPEVRADKVAELRRQIEQGEYHVDSQDLAADLLREQALQAQVK